MNDQIKPIIESFRKSAAARSDQQSSDKLVRQAALSSRDALNALRSVSMTEQIISADLIELNRDLLPEIIGQRFFETARYQAESHFPGGPRNLQTAWIERQLQLIIQHRELNGFYYQYYKTGSVPLDNFYFSSSAIQQEDMIMAEEPVAPDFVPPMSTVFARFRANDALEKLLIGWMSEFAAGPATAGPENLKPKWTGDMINLVELLYGLHLTGQINNGNWSMNELVRWAESSFQINIGIIQRKFAEIQRRKRLSPTKFLDLLREAVMKKMDEADA